MKKVVFCIPTITRPFQATLDSLAASIPLIEGAGWDHYMVSEVSNPYISAARSIMLRKALDVKPTAIVFIDHDLSWEPKDLLTLIDTDGDVVCGTYRYKKPGDHYMGYPLPDLDGSPRVRADGCVLGHSVPAGFLKITPNTINRFIDAYPELCYGDRYSPHVDLFNHGAHKNVWHGEDFAFSRNWRDLGGEIWIIPDLNINHHTADTKYVGNYHQHLMRQPGGSNDISHAS